VRERYESQENGEKYNTLLPPPPVLRCPHPCKPRGGMINISTHDSARRSLHIKSRWMELSPPNTAMLYRNSHLNSRVKSCRRGRFATAPDDRISFVRGGCNTPLTKEIEVILGIPLVAGANSSTPLTTTLLQWQLLHCRLHINSLHPLSTLLDIRDSSEDLW